jgi:tripartite-type tricarboxylate transporter receptor subunit TctC
MQQFRTSGIAIAIALALTEGPPADAAQSAAEAAYPNRPVRLLVGLPAGGSSDIIARVVMGRLADALGQPIVVDNRPGASGLIAPELAAKAPADGHTLLFRASFFSELVASLSRKLPYDMVADFAPVGLVATVPNVLVVNATFPVKSLSELIAHAKANPGKLNYASAGTGSSTHLSMELLKKHTGIDLVHVPYKGAPQALTALLSGEITVMFGNVPGQIAHLKSGKTRALAVTSATRAAQLPEVPTMIEAGIPGLEISVWFGVLAPARAPEPILEKLNRELVKTLAMPETKAALAKYGAEPAPLSRRDFAAFQQSEISRWTPVVQASGARLD